MTPMQEQYNEMKKAYPDAVILFRLGDFYEAFNDDAVTISKVLGITLTGRGKGDSRNPMAGIPHHALKTYLPKLIQAELKIAIADQMEEPVPGKLVERKITKIITPGTILDENSLEPDKNNYIASVYISEVNGKQNFSLVYCDLTTGDLKAFGSNSAQLFKIELEKFKPSEVICSLAQYERVKIIWHGFIEKRDASEFEYDKTYQILLKQFGVTSLKGYGVEGKKDLVSAAGALISYLIDCQKSEVKHIKNLKLYSYDNFMRLDPETIRNLEILYPLSGNDNFTTVFSVLNNCQNPMGKRLLRNWLLMPLINAEMLKERLDAVDFFFTNKIITSDIREFLKNMSDIERIVGRLGVGGANPKDLVALSYSLQSTLGLIETLTKVSDLPIRLKYLFSKLTEKNEEETSLSKVLADIVNLIQNSIKDDPSVVINEGGIIKDGYNQEVDELRSLAYGAKSILAQLQEREVKTTGISTLKVGFNQVFGYYIEVTKSHLAKVPANYVRKQTLANAERFITEELKNLEEKILSAEEKLDLLERDLFLQIRDQIVLHIQELLEVGYILAEMDVLTNFGWIAKENNYVKPIIKEQQNILDIQKGRHIVVEKLTANFVANSTKFENDSFIHILTGPNMSGKSTFIRQNALIVLLAQIGSFVPATHMEFSLVDRIFTRVGASDNLAHGESTFMVEMNETANILNNATSKSLVILDEVGRGTSTYDGVAIAWSIIEYLYSKLKCKTLFATHYHELIELENKYKGIVNYNVAVTEESGDITFQHKIIRGFANRSYGVHVAKLAGVPDEVVKRADEILEKFEGNGHKSKESIKESSKSTTPPKPRKIHPEQIGLI